MSVAQRWHPSTFVLHSAILFSPTISVYLHFSSTQLIWDHVMTHLLNRVHSQRNFPKSNRPNAWIQNMMVAKLPFVGNVHCRHTYSWVIFKIADCDAASYSIARARTHTRWHQLMKYMKSYNLWEQVSATPSSFEIMRKCGKTNSARFRYVNTGQTPLIHTVHAIYRHISGPYFVVVTLLLYFAFCCACNHAVIMHYMHYISVIPYLIQRPLFMKL